MSAINASVRAAIDRIEPLPGGGPNHYTVDVPDSYGLKWGVSAPTRPQLARLLWHWFQPE